MSKFVSNIEYNISPENEISVLLCHLNEDYMYDVIQDTIDKRFTMYQINNPPNIVSSFEQMFKNLLATYTSDLDQSQIRAKRQNVYSNILNILSRKYNIYINQSEILDLYSITFYLYDLLVSNFRTNIINFFSNFILKEKNNLYDSLNLNQFKKSKDSSTLYNKKIFKNNKLALILTNLEYVINNICAFDIPFPAILNNVYQDKNIIKFLENTVVPVQDFFKTVFSPVVMCDYKSILLTDIKLNIAGYSNNTINILEDE